MDAVPRPDTLPPACRVEGEMTIYRAAELKPVVVSAARADPPGLDLSGVTEIDTAGVQLLLLARRVAAARGVALHLVAASTAVCETLAFLGIPRELE